MVMVVVVVGPCVAMALCGCEHCFCLHNTCLARLHDTLAQQLLQLQQHSGRDHTALPCPALAVTLLSSPSSSRGFFSASSSGVNLPTLTAEKWEMGYTTDASAIAQQALNQQ